MRLGHIRLAGPAAAARLLRGIVDGLCWARTSNCEGKRLVSRIVKVAPFDLVVFGGTGDLAHRKLFPALFHRFLDAQFSQPTRIIGVSRRPLDHAAYRVAIANALKEFAAADARDEATESFL